jgi:hypothetical protein
MAIADDPRPEHCCRGHCQSAGHSGANASDGTLEPDDIGLTHLDCCWKLLGKEPFGWLLLVAAQDKLSAVRVGNPCQRRDAVRGASSRNPAGGAPFGPALRCSSVTMQRHGSFLAPCAEPKSAPSRWVKPMSSGSKTATAAPLDDGAAAGALRPRWNCSRLGSRFHGCCILHRNPADLVQPNRGRI